LVPCGLSRTRPAGDYRDPIMAQTIQKSPLTERHIIALKRMQKDFQEHLDFLLKCDKCKLDVDNEVKVTREQLSVIENLLREFPLPPTV
jgi:hypothetical protein